MNVQPVIARLFTRHQVNPATGCWEWTGACTRGYGAIRVAGRQEKAHRVAYEHLVGRIPAGQSVLHRCDNRRCINPDHLFLGTALDNMRDREAKGRANRVHGERHHAAKLTADQVRTIRARAAEGSKALAREFGLNSRHVRAILTRNAWKGI